MTVKTGRWKVTGQNRHKITISGLFSVLVNSLVDLVRSTARSRRDLHFGDIFGPDRPQKRYNKLDGVAKIVFYTGWRCLGWFCGRFGAKICSKCRSRRDLYLGRTKTIKKPLNIFKTWKLLDSAYFARILSTGQLK